MVCGGLPCAVHAIIEGSRIEVQQIVVGGGDLRPARGAEHLAGRDSHADQVGDPAHFGHRPVV